MADPWGDAELRARFMNPTPNSNTEEENMEFPTDIFPDLTVPDFDAIEDSTKVGFDDELANITSRLVRDNDETGITEDDVRSVSLDPAGSRTQNLKTILATFPKEKVRIRDIVSVMDCTGSQAYAAMLNLQRAGEPVFSDGRGMYWYDPDNQPVDRHASTRPKKTAPANKLHEAGVVLYETLDRGATVDTKGRRVIMARTTELVAKMTPSHRAMFQNRGGFAQSFITQVHGYLVDIGALRIVGPRKYLLAHPDEAVAVRNEQDAVLRDAGLVTVPFTPPADAAADAPPLPVGWDLGRSETTDPAVPSDNPVDQVDPTLLANALAHGMWLRYEMILTELGESREQIARLEEAIRNREREIARLRGMLPRPTVTDIAKQLLDDSE